MIDDINVNPEPTDDRYDAEPELADMLGKRFFHLASELENEAAANGCFCESKTLLDAATRIRRALDTDQP